MVKEVAPSGPPVAATRPSSQRKRKATVGLGLGHRSYSGALPKDLQRNLEQSETKGVGLHVFLKKKKNVGLHVNWRGGSGFIRWLWPPAR